MGKLSKFNKENEDLIGFKNEQWLYSRTPLSLEAREPKISTDLLFNILDIRIGPL